MKGKVNVNDSLEFTAIQCPHIRIEAICARSPATEFFVVCVDCYRAVQDVLKLPGRINRLANELAAGTEDNHPWIWESVTWHISDVELRASTDGFSVSVTNGSLKK